MRRRFGVFVLLFPLGLFLGGCDTTSPGESSLTLLLTDAPGDVREAWVTIDRIYLQAGAEEPGSGAPGIDLMTSAVTVDLMTLANDIEALVEGAVVPTGHYAQLRVVVSAACVKVETETADVFEVYATQGFAACGAPNGTLVAPSLAETGVKVLLSEGAVEVTGEQHVLLLDFDVAQSFGRATGTAGWVMNPVIRGGEIGLTASITVNLSLGEGVTLPEGMTLASFEADLSAEEADAAFSDADGDGTHTAVFEHIVPDAAVTYVVTVEAPEGASGYSFTFEPASAEADVVSGMDTVVNFTLTAVTAL